MRGVSANRMAILKYNLYKYRGADKSLARPGRKKVLKHVRRRARFQQHGVVNSHEVFFLARQSAEGNSRNSDRNISLFPSWSASGLISTPVMYKVVDWIKLSDVGAQ